MKYYSEVTKKVYNTVEDLAAAEEAIAEEHKIEEEKKKIREEREKELNDAIAVATEKVAKADELLQAFVNDYGSFQRTTKNSNGFNSLIRKYFYF